MTITAYTDPAKAMDTAVTEYATGERARPVVATDGEKFYVCSKATAKTNGWDIESVLFLRNRKAGKKAVAQAKTDAVVVPAAKVEPEAQAFFDALASDGGKQAKKRAERKAKLAEMKAGA